MSEKNIFYELAMRMAPKQAREIDALTEEAPILAMMPMQPASNGLQNVYEELSSIEGAQVVNLDSELPLIDANGKLGYTDLSVIGGIIQVGMDKARKFGGAAAYFASKIPAIFRQTSMNIEYSLYYNTLIPYAKANGKQISAGGSNNTNYSMVGVRFVEGETTGLYDPTGFGKGDVFDVLPLHDGALTKFTTENGQVIPGYETLIKSYIGFQFSNPRNVASIVNIDLREDEDSPTGRVALPTESEIDDFLESFRASPENSFIYCHPKVLNALKVYKGGALQMTPVDKSYNRIIMDWDGIRFVTSRNLLNGTELNQA